MIARDREATIGRALDSVAPFVDELLVVDTGSSDMTVEIAKEHGARVEHFPWCDDFAAARNYALDAGTCDWAFVLDSDEYLDSASGPDLRTVVQNGLPADRHAYLATIQSINAKGRVIYYQRYHPRLFPRSTRLRWEGVIYELLRYLPNPTETGYCRPACEIVVWHTGYALSPPELRAKFERNRLCLEWALQRNPIDASTLVRAAQLCSETASSRECIRLCKRFLDIGDPRCTDWLPCVYLLWIMAAFHLRDALELAEARNGAEGDRAYTRLTHFLLGGWEVIQTQGGWDGEPEAFRAIRAAEAPIHLERAIEHFELALRLPRVAVKTPGYVTGVYGSEAFWVPGLRVTDEELHDAINTCRTLLASAGIQVLR